MLYWDEEGGWGWRGVGWVEGGLIYNVSYKVDDIFGIVF